MEAGVRGKDRLDLIDAMVQSADPSKDDAEVAAIEAAACPGCGRTSSSLKTGMTTVSFGMALALSSVFDGTEAPDPLEDLPGDGIAGPLYGPSTT